MWPNLPPGTQGWLHIKRSDKIKKELTGDHYLCTKLYNMSAVVRRPVRQFTVTCYKSLRTRSSSYDWQSLSMQKRSEKSRLRLLWNCFFYVWEFLRNFWSDYPGSLWPPQSIWPSKLGPGTVGPTRASADLGPLTLNIAFDFRTQQELRFLTLK